MSTTEMLFWLLMFGLVALLIIIGEAVSDWRYQRKINKDS